MHFFINPASHHPGYCTQEHRGKTGESLTTHEDWRNSIQVHIYDIYILYLYLSYKLTIGYGHGTMSFNQIVRLFSVYQLIQFLLTDFEWTTHKSCGIMNTNLHVLFNLRRVFFFVNWGNKKINIHAEWTYLTSESKSEMAHQFDYQGKIHAFQAWWWIN